METTLEELTKELDDGMAVYRHYMGHDVRPNRNLRSPFPFRKDSHPSFRIYRHQTLGTWYFKDFADRWGSHWDFVMYMDGVDFAGAVQKVRREILRQVGGVKASARCAGYQALRTPSAADAKWAITPEIRKWRDHDLAFWGRFDASPALGEPCDLPTELGRRNIYAARRVHFAKGERAFAWDELESDPIYCLFFPQTGHCKVYRPLTLDRRRKWLSNVDGERDLFCFDLVPARCEKIVITAGNKDTWAFHLLTGDRVPAFPLNSESALMTEGLYNELLYRVGGRPDRIFSLFNNDPDKVGTDGRVTNMAREKTEQLERRWGIRPAWQPLHEHGANDVAELVETLKKGPGARRDLEQVRDFYLNL